MKKCKVYKDGSHYIAIRPTTGYSGVRRKPPSEDPIIVEELSILGRVTSLVRRM